MLRSLLAIAALMAAATTISSSPAAAHPHVWVSMKSELIYAPNGMVIGVRHVWTFDDMYSAFATQGLESKQRGVFTREELAPLAAENVIGLKEFDYFTFAKLDGKSIAFSEPVNYWAEYKDSLLSLHFTLPLKAPAKMRTADLEVYDPTYFVDFSFAEDKPLVLTNAPSNCQFALDKPTQAELAAEIRNLGEEFFATADAENFGAMFANKVSVKCP